MFEAHGLLVATRTVASRNADPSLRSGPQPAASCLRFLQLYDMRNGRGEAVPVAGFLFQVPAAEPRQRIEFGAPVVLAEFPFGGDPALLFELDHSGTERAVTDLKNVPGDLLQALADGQAVQRLEREDFQKQQVQRALDEVGWLAHCALPGYRG